MSIWKRVVIGLAFLAGLLVGQLHAQDGVADAFRLQVQAIPAPDGVDSLWAAMENCSGVRPQLGGDLQDVSWYVGNLLEIDPRHKVVGLWLPPSTIVLDFSAVRDKLVIAHELLHHLLRGPNLRNTHPVTPFLVPCKVIPPIVGG